MRRVNTFSSPLPPSFALSLSLVPALRPFLTSAKQPPMRSSLRSDFLALYNLSAKAGAFNNKRGKEFHFPRKTWHHNKPGQSEVKNERRKKVRSDHGGGEGLDCHIARAPASRANPTKTHNPSDPPQFEEMLDLLNCDRASTTQSSLGDFLAVASHTSKKAVAMTPGKRPSVRTDVPWTPHRFVPYETRGGGGGDDAGGSALRRGEDAEKGKVDGLLTSRTPPSKPPSLAGILAFFVAVLGAAVVYFGKVDEARALAEGAVVEAEVQFVVAKSWFLSFYFELVTKLTGIEAARGGSGSVDSGSYVGMLASYFYPGDGAAQGAPPVE